MTLQAVSTETFFQVSKIIVEKFIQSVVAVDDQMSFDERPYSIESHELIKPDDEDTIFGGTEVDSSVSKGIGVGSDGHKLYYQELASAFAQKGIVCSGFKPLSKNENTISSINTSSRNADITILDWQMDGTNTKGELAIASIKKLIELDIKEGGRLRLIAIYTAENKTEVVGDLSKALQDKSAQVDQGIITFSDDALKYCKIDVVGKEKNGEELTDYVVESFTHLTTGLLSNAALSAVSDIRDKTHNILYKFNKSLDPAYLSHVLGLISSPDMREKAHEVAFDYAVDLLSEEIKSELQISDIVKESLSQNTLKLWPSHVNTSDTDNYFRLKIGKLSEVKFGSERMSDLLATSTNECLKSALNTEPKLAVDGDKDPIHVFKNSEIQLSTLKDSTPQHLELSAIQCVRRDLKTNGYHTPVMKQGTVIKGAGNKYYVCIQPLCDSVRLKEDTNFTFLRISKVKSGKPFSHVMRSDMGVHIRLCIEASSKRLNVFKFSACDNSRVVKAEKEHGKFLFREKLYGEDVEWCGEFKQAVSQEIVNAVSASIARVGLDSFEWLRFKSG